MPPKKASDRSPVGKGNGAPKSDGEKSTSEDKGSFISAFIPLYYTSRSSRRRKRRLCAACAPGYGYSQIIGFIETQTRGSKQKVWNLNHYTMKLD